METAKLCFNTYKLTARLPLQRLATFFAQREEAGRKEFIKIAGTEVEKILKYAAEEKAVYLYKYGCVTFLNFAQDEIAVFLDHLDALYVELDYRMLTRYQESHCLMLSCDGFVCLWEGDEVTLPYVRDIEDMVAGVLARSVELARLEREISQVLDETGDFLKDLQRGYLRANTKKMVLQMAQSIRFKFKSVESLSLLGRPAEFSRAADHRQIYDRLSQYYELAERYGALKNRLEVLDSITKAYGKFGNRQAERRLLLFEILLLASFPLLHFMSK